MLRTAHFLLLAGLLAGTALTALAQTDPTKQLPPDHYYLNGKPSTKQEIDALDKKAIKSIEVFTGKEAVSRSHDPASKKIAMVTTN